MAMLTPDSITIIPVKGIGEITLGDNVAAAIVNALDAANIALANGDILVITQKIVSKSEGRVIQTEDDAAYRRLVLAEATEIIRRRGDLVIAKTQHGFICANAGVDRSNTAPGTAILLPRDPDHSAHAIHTYLKHRTGITIPIIISDTFGRPWRRGLTDVAIGISGLKATEDLRGTPDAYGRMLDVTEIAIVDELASAANLVMGKADNIPAAIVRGASAPRGTGRATDIVRPSDEDLFR